MYIVISCIAGMCLIHFCSLIINCLPLLVLQLLHAHHGPACLILDTFAVILVWVEDVISKLLCFFQ